MSRSPSSTPSEGSTSVTWGFPVVMVPVLSSTTVRTSWALSRIWALFTNMPSLAPRPVPTMMAVGVASPRAQGQLITSTLTPWTTAAAQSKPLISSQIAKTATATAITAGTNTPLMRSAMRWMGALLLVASSTSRMICARAVCSPTAVTRMVK